MGRSLVKDPGVGVPAFCDGNVFLDNKLNNSDNPRLKTARTPLLPSPFCRAFSTEQDQEAAAQATQR